VYRSLYGAREAGQVEIQTFCPVEGVGAALDRSASACWNAMRQVQLSLCATADLNWLASASGGSFEWVAPRRLLRDPVCFQRSHGHLIQRTESPAAQRNMTRRRRIPWRAVRDDLQQPVWSAAAAICAIFTSQDRFGLKCRGSCRAISMRNGDITEDTANRASKTPLLANGALWTRGYTCPSSPTPANTSRGPLSAFAPSRHRSGNSAAEEHYVPRFSPATHDLAVATSSPNCTRTPSPPAETGLGTVPTPSPKPPRRGYRVAFSQVSAQLGASQHGYGQTEEVPKETFRGQLHRGRKS
jgi:hypothetical protein